MLRIRQLFHRFFHSSMGYLPFKIIEGFFGIVSLSIYSFILSPVEYGKYGTVNSAVMLVYLLSIGWLFFISIRRIQGLHSLEEKKSFYTNVFFIQGLVSALLMIVYIIGIAGINVFKETDPWLFISVFIFFGGYMLNQYYVGLLLYVERRFENVVITLMMSLCKPLLVYLFYKSGVSSSYIIFLGHGIVEVFLGGYAFFLVKPYAYFDRKLLKKGFLKETFQYGFPLIGLTLTMYILNLSDRYMILFFRSEYEVGLYVSNYMIASSAFIMISYGLSRGFLPKLMDAWNHEEKEKAFHILAGGIKNFVFLALPAAVGMLLLQEKIGALVVDQRYQEGYRIIGIVAIGMLFLGLAEYANKGWELTTNTRPIFFHSLIAAICNIVLNLIFIPLYGFKSGAYTTAVAFFIYFIISYTRRNKEVEIILPKKVYLGMILSTGVMSIVVKLCSYLPAQGMIQLFLSILFGMLSYFSMILVMKVYKKGV